MEYRRLIFLSAVFLISILFAGKIYAQEIEQEIKPEETKNYYMTHDENNNIKFVQKLSWNKVENIKYFKVTIQKFEKGKYETILEKDQNENFIEVSFEAGKYRFQVGAVDIFDKIPKKSEWKEFEILRVKQPQISTIVPDTIYLNGKGADGILTVTGKNLFPQSLFQMQHKTKNGEEENFSAQVLGVTNEEEISKAQIQFDLSELVKGSYEFFVLNPGGFSDSYKNVNVKERFFIGYHVQFAAGYAPLFAPFGGTLEEYFDKKIFLLGFAAKLSALGTTSKSGDIGLGISANFSMLENNTKLYDISGKYFNVMANLIYQKFVFKEIIKLDFHAGAGISILQDLNFKYNKDFLGVNFESPKESFAGLAFGGGFAVQFYPFKKKNIFLEIGADIVYSKFKDMDFIKATPSVSVGGMF